ncbi:hypothetical protein HPP92_026806 [Vanilla planifolia]|nr:hypothetical protein HPP92_026806 [Vanilla planifolia]
MVKLIEVEADSFAKKAEMYYQRRPELISFVEETYRAYKALADRYDRISGELHKANHTLASAFPDQFQCPKLCLGLPQVSFKGKGRGKDAFSALKKQHKKVSSHLTKETAQKEIDRLQKEILVLQTEKEFFKSSYEGGLAKFWDIETQINDLQDEVCNLQDEFSTSSIIEDDEARALVAATAIKSCEETLVSLQQQHSKSREEAIVESKRITEAKNRLKLLRGDDGTIELEDSFDEETKTKVQVLYQKEESLDLHSVCAQVKNHIQTNSETSMADLAEKIDELVEKVITLEITVSSQTAQLRTLRSETDELQKHIRGLEEDKAKLLDSNSMSHKLRKAAEEVHRIQEIERSVNCDTEMAQTQFADACNCLNGISEKLQSLGQKDEGLSDEINEKALDNGTESRQRMLVCEYTETLGNYKDTKTRLTEMEKKNQEHHFEMMTQIQGLKSANAVKDQEIRALRKKLFSHTGQEENGASIQVNLQKSDLSVEIVDTEEDIKQPISGIEEKYRAELDKLVEENLDFWLRFSTSYHQIQKFEASFKDLQARLEKMKDYPKEGGSSPASPKCSPRKETPPLDQKLRELHTELQVWLEQNGLLKGELQRRCASLCAIQEEVSRASWHAEDSKFDPYLVAKFHGEVFNMQQQNNKVAKELQTGLDHVKGLQSEVAVALSKVRERFDLGGLNGYQQCNNLRQLSAKAKVPLRTFLFGEKKKKPSIFSCMSPALHRHHGHMKSGFPP